MCESKITAGTDEPNVRAEYSGLYEEQLRNIIEGYEVVPGEEEPVAWTSTIEERKKLSVFLRTEQAFNHLCTV